MAFPMYMFLLPQQNTSGILAFRELLSRHLHEKSTAFLSHEPACDLL